MLGTYIEAVTVVGTATVTIVGATATAAADWSENEVVISNIAVPLTIGSSNSKGVTLRNLNFITTASTANAVALALRGDNIAFYGCSIVSPGATAISASYGLTLFANSRIEGTDKIFYNVPSMYVYKSTIVPLASGASIVYSKGATQNNVFYNSTVVFDSGSIVQKSGYTNTGVFLAAPNGVGASAIYRGVAMGSLISSAGIHPSAATVSSFYGEFANTGTGSYASNAASRAAYDNLLSADQVSQYTIDKVFANAFYPYGSSSTSWIDSTVLSSIANSDAAQIASSPAVVSSSSVVASFSPASSSVAGSSSSVSGSTSSVTASSTGFIASESTTNSTVSASVVSSSSSVIVSSTASMATSTTLNSTVPASISATSTAASCSPSATLIVSKTPGACDYSNVTAAIAALPNDSKAYTIQIGPGVYNEQISITRNGKVTLIGATNSTQDFTQNQVTIQASNGVLTSAGQDEKTPVINAKKANDNSGLALYNINFANIYPQTTNTAALAADFYGANIAAYGCSFKGFQDTLLANKGTQVFSNCYIEGSIDFVWGFSTAFFHQCMIVANTPGGCNAAQSRSTATSVGGYVFDHCVVTYSSTYGNSFGLSYLGRPYSQYSIAVYTNSFIDKHISAAGWSVWQTNNPQTSGVMFGEYANTGPGSWQASTQRASFATNLTATQAAQYELAAWIGDTTWLDQTAYNYVPSYSLTGTASSASSSSPATNTTTSTGSTSTSTINAHPDSGTVPPADAVIVSVDGSHNASFTNVTAALASLPKDNTNQTIFLFPGSYNEQVPTINRPGAVRIIGYTTGNSGQSYKDNTVTITFSRGLSVSPLPVGHSDAETATVQTASSRISFYNIAMINTDNLDGAEASYVTLAASIYGNDIAFYGCSFDGWQDTLLNGATAGYQYYESCYVGGAIDFIWGYSKAYFKGCTIGAKRKSSAMTAQSRASSSAIGGYIFDNCLFTTAPGVTTDLTNSVYLGRPYSAYALVVIKNSYIDSTIAPAGWKIWSATDPRTDHITFAEYNNVGPSNWESNVAARQAFGNATLLTSDTYPLSSVMDSTEWIDMTYWSSIVTPAPAVIVPAPPAGPSNITVTGNSTVDGMTPPSGALIVSKSPITGMTTYQTIQDALNAAPTTSKTNATIFIYPGTYNEQLIVNKSGTTIFMGYSNATNDYSANQVSIEFNHGIDTQGTTGSDTDGATVYATGNYFYAYNINFRNVAGTTQNIASLGFAVKSSKFAALYACQIYGNQDTLDISGSLFTFKTYIEGNVDFIFGSGSGYFLDSTISPNEDGINLTADKRATSTTAGGLVFDQCKIVPAPGAGPFTNVGLGRPWNNNSRVAYVDCYLDSMIKPAGWNQWSTSAPQTNGVLYGEYHNYGPGSNICARASYSEQLSDSDVVQFQLGNFFASTGFIDFSRVDTQPFKVGIGSAQTCATPSSSTILASSTISSSATRSSSIMSSSVSSSSLPVVTVYTTTTAIVKITASTTITQPDVTSTTIVKVTSTASITAADVVVTSIDKETATVSISSPDVTSTSTIVVTENDGLTITPAAITKNSVVSVTTTIGGSTTAPAPTTTVKGTTTTNLVQTVNPKPTTITQSEGSTVTVVSTITPKRASTTIKTTTSVDPSSTKTTTVKAKSSVTVSTVSLKTVTKTTTTTESCIPTTHARMVRRGAVIPRAAASTTTITISTAATSIVKTVTATQAGSTALATQTSVAKIQTVTQPGVTSITTLTSFVKTKTIAQAGTTQLTTVTSTSTIGKTTTLKASTTTILSTSYITKQQVQTITPPAVTVSSMQTRTSTATVTAAQQTIVITKSADTTSTVRTTLPVATQTFSQITTQGGGVVTSTVTAPAGTKTVVAKSTTTVLVVATKTAKNAPACE